MMLSMPTKQRWMLTQPLQKGTTDFLFAQHKMCVYFSGE
jgi:hypothetical protein